MCDISALASACSCTFADACAALIMQAVQVLETGNTGHAPHPPATAAPHNGPVAAGVGPVHTAVLTEVTQNAMNRGVGVQSPGDRPRLAATA